MSLKWTRRLLLVFIILFFILVGAFAGYSLRTGERAARRAESAERRLQTLEQRIQKVFHVQQNLARYVADQIIREFVIYGPRSTTTPGHLPSPPGPVPRASQQPPIPTEPGGDQGSLLPVLCNNGLGDDFDLDCSPQAPMASTQILCRLGFDDVFQMNCGKGDKDGPETPGPTP